MRLWFTLLLLRPANNVKYRLRKELVNIDERTVFLNLHIYCSLT